VIPLGTNAHRLKEMQKRRTKSVSDFFITSPEIIELNDFNLSKSEIEFYIIYKIIATDKDN
jgi:hypothetical protein